MLTVSETIDAGALVASLTDWWALAGADCAVRDAPRNWLTPEPRPAAQPVAKAAPETAPVPVAPLPQSPPASTVAMPDTLEGFLQWLATDSSIPEASFAAPRLVPTVSASAPLLIVIDMPTDEDLAAGRLLSGEDGALIKAMLSAIGLEMDRVGVASLLVSRPSGGICDDAIWQKAGTRLQHFVSLAAPQHLLLLGDRTNRAFGETSRAEESGNWLTVNHAKGKISAMLMPALHIVMRHPARKAAVWADLRKLAVTR
jgi:DNA polymerase